MESPVVIGPASFNSPSDWDRPEGYIAGCSDEELTLLLNHTEFLANYPAHLFVATSGSTGTKKWVALPLKGLQTACREFNLAFRMERNSIVLNSLPLSHIGGIMALLRAREGNYDYQSFEGTWSPSRFYKQLCKSHVDLISLVPTQLHDLLALELKSPDGLRVLTGGAALSKEIGTKANKYGWNITHSYGATETGALVALTEDNSATLKALPHAEIAVSPHNTLQVKAASVASAILHSESAQVQSLRQSWESEDEIELLSHNTFRVIGRLDEIYKNKGKKQSLHAARDAWEAISSQFLGSGFRDEHLSILLTFEHPREGHSLGLAVLDTTNKSRLLEAVKQFNQLKHSQFGEIKELRWYSSFPRLSNQKIATHAISQDIRSKHLGAGRFQTPGT